MSEIWVLVVLVDAEEAWTNGCLPEFGQPRMVHQLFVYHDAVLARHYTYSV